MENFIKPEVVVLSKEAYIPTENIISPAPNQFTHKLVKTQSYYFHGIQQATTPNGEFPIGTKIVLMRYEGGSFCRVVNEQGLYVEIEFSSLEKL